MRILTLLNILLMIFWFAGCAKVETPVNIPAHPNQWMDENSEEFHANKVILIGDMTCKSCHGQDLGEANSFCNNCHAKQPRPLSYPHPPDWMDFKSDNNHGKFVEKYPDDLNCNRCHGGVNDLAPACSDCHIAEQD